MCESDVYMVDENGKEELVLKSVDKVIPSGNEVILESIFSERKIIQAVIKEMALLEHKIILKKVG